MKKKILVIAIVSCILVLSIAGSSIAYFTDIKEATNVFTVGDVKIQITEAKVKTDVNNWHIIKDESQARQINTGLDYKTIRSLWPGQSVYKDPRIENIGSEDAYVGAIITISGMKELLTTDAIINAFISGGALSDANNTLKWVVSGNDIVIYVIVARPLSRQTTEGVVDSVELFNNISIPATWDNDQMKKLENLNVTVEAYATQTAGFADAKTAIKTAFNTKFAVVTP